MTNDDTSVENDGLWKFIDTPNSSSIFFCIKWLAWWELAKPKKKTKQNKKWNTENQKTARIFKIISTRILYGTKTWQLVADKWQRMTSVAPESFYTQICIMRIHKIVQIILHTLYIRRTFLLYSKSTRDLNSRELWAQLKVFHFSFSFCSREIVRNCSSSSFSSLFCFFFPHCFYWIPYIYVECISITPLCSIVFLSCDLKTVYTKIEFNENLSKCPEQQYTYIPLSISFHE